MPLEGRNHSRQCYPNQSYLSVKKFLKIPGLIIDEGFALKLGLLCINFAKYLIAIAPSAFLPSNYASTYRKIFYDTIYQLNRSQNPLKPIYLFFGISLPIKSVMERLAAM
tara:strand:+ start:229 stop:558 length:330 start_codon:yes stop_codon:yes gene_type:complete